MEKLYKHVFFDLDHTLWDFERNSSEVLWQLYNEHELHKLGVFTKEDFSNQFSLINTRLWESFNVKAIDKDYLRNERFNLVFDALGFKNPDKAKGLAEHYLQLCPAMPHVFPFVQEVLQYLKNEKRYQLHILSNGFSEVQHIKLNSAKIHHYFDEIITADATGFQKPDSEMFQYAFKKIECRETECIMIGDNLIADIQGAKRAGIDQIFFNPNRVSHSQTITYEICCLSELFSIL